MLTNLSEWSKLTYRRLRGCWLARGCLVVLTYWPRFGTGVPPFDYGDERVFAFIHRNCLFTLFRCFHSLQHLTDGGIEAKVCRSVQFERKVLQHVKAKLSLYLTIGYRADIGMAVKRKIPSPQGLSTRTSWLIASSFTDCIKILTSLLTELSPSWGAVNCAAPQESPQHFMEPEGSIPCSQEPSTGPYPEPYQSNPLHPIRSH
jgi:hypothetical protein